MRQRLPPRQRVHHFHLRVPALDAVFHVERHDADVDGFDDVLVEILQALVLRHFLLQRSVEPAVLDGDAEIAAERFEQLHVFAGKVVALGGLSQAEHGDGLLLRAAGNVVVQIEAGDGVLRSGGLARHLVRVLEEHVAGGLGTRRAQESQIELAHGIHANRLGEDELLGFFARAQENRDAVHGQGARQPVQYRGEQRVQIRFRTQLAAKFNQRAPVVIDGAVEELVDAVLNPFAHRIKQQRRDHYGQDQSHRARAGLPHVDQRRQRPRPARNTFPRRPRRPGCKPRHA